MDSERKIQGTHELVSRYGLILTAHADEEARETQGALSDYARAKEEAEMKCDLCTKGNIERKRLTRNYKWHGKTIVIEDVPALVCDRCGDILIREETVKAIDGLLMNEAQPREYAPIYRFPAKVA